MAKDKKDSLTILYLKEAVQYSMRDDLGGAGKMLRSLRACLSLGEVKSKLKKGEFKSITEKLDALEDSPSPNFSQGIYALCGTYYANPSEIEVLRDGVIIRLANPSELHYDLRKVMDELTKIAGTLSESLGISGFITKEFQAIGLEK